MKHIPTKPAKLFRSPVSGESGTKSLCFINFIYVRCFYSAVQFRYSAQYHSYLHALQFPCPHKLTFQTRLLFSAQKRSIKSKIDLNLPIRFSAINVLSEIPLYHSRAMVLPVRFIHQKYPLLYIRAPASDSYKNTLSTMAVSSSGDMILSPSALSEA